MAALIKIAVHLLADAVRFSILLFRSKPRICFFADNWHCSKSAESGRGV
jgi:hypothetical protein